MKKTLCLIESINERTDLSDVLLEIAVGLHEQNQKVTVFVQSATGGEVCERLQVKGIPLFDVEHACYPTMEKDYDVILAFDDWGINKSRLFKSAEKIKADQESDPDEVIEKIMGADDFSEAEDEEETTGPSIDDLKTMIQCPECGSDNTAGAAECAMCGAKFEQESKSETRRKAAQRSAAKKATGKKKSGSKK